MLLQTILFILLATTSNAAAIQSTVTAKSSISIDKAPSGMFYDPTTTLLHVLCGTATNADHYLYTYNTDGTQQCLITIPESVGMTRVDGFYIVGNKAYISDSQGPIYSTTAGKLGGSVYQVDWSTHPCGCTSDGKCSSSSVEWIPTVLKNWALSATETTIGDGGGVDDDFRNSGIVVTEKFWYAVNGVHPISNSLTQSYPKSIVKVDMSSAQLKNVGFAPVVGRWSFDATTLGHEVDMEGLTCGADKCVDSLYIGDEYNFIYKLDFNTSTVTHEWNLNDIVGDVNADKGIESLAFDGTYFYAGIQGTSVVHQVSLNEAACGTQCSVSTGSSTGSMLSGGAVWSMVLSVFVVTVTSNTFFG